MTLRPRPLAFATLLAAATLAALPPAAAQRRQAVVDGDYIVVRAHAHGASKYSNNRLFKLLPIVGAILVTIIGLWLAREGAQQLFSPPPPGQEHHS